MEQPRTNARSWSFEEAINPDRALNYSSRASKALLSESGSLIATSKSRGKERRSIVHSTPQTKADGCPSRTREADGGMNYQRFCRLILAVIGRKGNWASARDAWKCYDPASGGAGGWVRT